MTNWMFNNGAKKVYNPSDTTAYRKIYIYSLHYICFQEVVFEGLFFFYFKLSELPKGTFSCSEDNFLKYKYYAGLIFCYIV